MAAEGSATSALTIIMERSLVFPGKKFNIGGTDYVVPALSLGQLRNGALEKFRLHDELVAAGKLWDAVLVRGELIVEALRRNYPTIEDEVLHAVGIDESVQLWNAVVGLSVPGETEAGAKPPTAAQPGASGQSTTT